MYGSYSGFIPKERRSNHELFYQFIISIQKRYSFSVPVGFTLHRCISNNAVFNLIKAFESLGSKYPERVASGI